MCFFLTKASTVAFMASNSIARLGNRSSIISSQGRPKVLFSVSSPEEELSLSRSEESEEDEPELEELERSPSSDSESV